MTTRLASMLLACAIGCGGKAPAISPLVSADSSAAIASEETEAPGTGVTPWSHDTTEAVARYLAIPISVAAVPVPDYSVLGATSTGAGDTLQVATLWCTEMLGTVKAPARMTCAAEPPAGAREGHIAQSRYEGWRRGMERCGVTLADRPARPDEIDALKPELRWRHGEGLPGLGEDELVIVSVYHQNRQRVYQNSCSGVRRAPCTPIRSWATTSFETVGERIAFSQYLVGAHARGFLGGHDASYADMVVVAFGARKDGWFVADPIFDDIASDAATPATLQRAHALAPEDPGDELALRLTLVIVAARIADPNTQQYAREFVALADAADLSRLHFELAPHIRKVLPFARSLAAGALTVTGPCASALPERGSVSNQR